ncbi:MAG: hypothetical protein KGJ23_09905 [Euryarchaeota archaeon]|nr:hypothetical protein [Euryarchaeota archaeon]MDE1836917.1 hypothetical protein [Euryarchaeota archaeon]MDE2045098.1 hypothetical protein [Thermoplasmata archaeon]
MFLSPRNLTAPSIMAYGGTYEVSVLVGTGLFGCAAVRAAWPPALHNVSVRFYLTNGSALTNPAATSLGGSPVDVAWYGSVGGVLNRSANAIGVLPSLHFNQSELAVIHFSPSGNESGSWNLCANATGTQTSSTAYNASANIACGAVTILPPGWWTTPLGQGVVFGSGAGVALFAGAILLRVERRRRRSG